MSGYGSILFEQHQEKLRSCAIDPQVAAARGYRTADTKRVLERHHFLRLQRRVPALLIPVWGVDGNVVLHQARPDEPRMNSKGKPIKYETPGGSRMALDVHPRTRTVLGDPKVPLVITEGVLKADSLLSHGQHALGPGLAKAGSAAPGRTSSGRWSVAVSTTFPGSRRRSSSTSTTLASPRSRTGSP